MEKRLYKFDQKAPRSRNADHIMFVPARIFGAFQNRDYIIRSSEKFQKINTIKVIHKQTDETRYFEIKTDVRPAINSCGKIPV